jgi:hypothetical protein
MIRSVYADDDALLTVKLLAAAVVDGMTSG